MVGTFLVHDLEAVDHVAGEIFARRETKILVEAVVVCLEGIRDYEVADGPDTDPIGEFAIERAAVIQKAAELQMETPRIGARPPRHPADRTHPGDALDRLDGETHMLAFDLCRDRLIVPSTLAVADDLVPVLDKGAGEFGVAIGRFGDRQ